MNELYRTLGVPPSADAERLKRAYRALAKQFHPDLNPGDVRAEARFKEINEAYAVLGDLEKRRKYDEAQRPAHQRATHEADGPFGRKRPTGPMDFAAAEQGFAHFFGFDPVTGADTGQKRTAGGKDPFDISELFERFMGVKDP